MNDPDIPGALVLDQTVQTEQRESIPHQILWAKNHELHVSYRLESQRITTYSLYLIWRYSKLAFSKWPHLEWSDIWLHWFLD